MTLVTSVYDDGVATITLDSVHNRNALSTALVTELFAALEAAENHPEVKVVVLAASGTVFCSGADLSEAAATTDFSQGPRAIVALQRAILTLSKPVVCRIQGPVRAGGLGLVAASDIAIAATSVNFALTEVKLGLAAAAISLTVLPRLSSRAAAYTFLSGAKFSATEAVEVGLITMAADDLDAEVTRVVAELKTGSAQGLRETKRLLTRELIAGIDEHGEAIALRSAQLFTSEEAREAMVAFLSRKRA